jgi:putative ATP-dependent endonuclease of OLD family
LLAEGATEAAAMPAVARRLAELNPASYKSLEALGICTVDAGTDSQIADLGAFYRSLNKVVFAICDHQTPQAQANIEAHVDTLFMHAEAGFEALVLKNTTQPAKERFIASLAWPPHLSAKYANPAADPDNALMDYFAWSKGNWGISDFLIQCTEAEIPQWIRDTCSSLKQSCDPPAPPPPVPEEAAAAAV